MGWHWGWKVADTGLPIRLSSIKSACTSWEFDLTHRTHGGTNVSHDIWLADDPHHGSEDPTGEVMIWLYNTGDIRPIGSKRANTTIEGTSWDLWAGRHPESGWPVCSFVRAANTCEESLDLMAFFRHLASVGLSTPDYLLGVEAGAEVFAGEGELDTTRYSVDVECR